MRLILPAWIKQVQRWWRHAAVAGALASIAALAIGTTDWRAPIRRNMALETCLSQRSLCAADRVSIEGAFAPESLRTTADCPAQLTLQSPGGTPAGTLDVCAKNWAPLTRSPRSLSICDDPEMALVMANGYYNLSVTGHLDGSLFRADEIVGGGCEPKYYAWRYGPAALKPRD